MTTAGLHILANDEIDKQRWDECLEQAANKLIYGFSYYLDEIAPRWKAIVDKDYRWVMPLPRRQKMGIAYLYVPAFTQQLGVFYKEDVVVPWKEIMMLLEKEFTYWNVSWNYTTPITLLRHNIEHSVHTNFILRLDTGYDKIAIGYSGDLKRNLKRAAKFKYLYATTDDFDSCINIYRKYYGERIPHVTDEDYAGFRNICAHLQGKGNLYCRQVADIDGEQLAIILLLSDGKRLYNLMNTTTAAGRKTEANHFLLDQVIREFSGKDLLFDFEGSDLPGVKQFYQNFGVSNQPYFGIKYNKLPLPLRWLKK